MNFKHGLTSHELYGTWNDIKRRCINKKILAYKNYGGRGIKICERWNEFDLFLADMGERPSGYTIERIDNDGDYCPQNCKWIQRSKQASNQRQRRKWHINGTVFKTATEAAKKLNKGRVTIWRWCKTKPDCYFESLF